MTSRWWDYVGAISFGMTQQDVSDHTGIDKSVLSRWKLGRNKPSAELAIDFARSFKVDPIKALIAAGYLTDGEGVRTEVTESGRRDWRNGAAVARWNAESLRASS
jgi:transcriptional regulator with XRE-family HTH domain